MLLIALFLESFYSVFARPIQRDSRYRLEKLAEAHRQRVILEAEAEAEAIRMKGEAQSFAVEAKAKAEAEQMSKKAAAFKEYREAAMVDMLLNTLPKVRVMERECLPFFLPVHSFYFVSPPFKCWRSRPLCFLYKLTRISSEPLPFGIKFTLFLPVA